jgi:two-component system sensor histidine kinase KdpD
MRDRISDSRTFRDRLWPGPGNSTWRLYLSALAVVAISGIASWVAHELGLSNANVVMLFLAGVALVAARLGHGPAIASAILSVLVFDYFFVDPIFSFAPSDAQYFVDLAVMLGIAVLVSELTARLQSQLHAAQERERRTRQLCRRTRRLDGLVGLEELVQIAGHELSEIFGGDVVLFICDEDAKPQLCFGQGSHLATDPETQAAADAVALTRQPVGAASTTLSHVPARFVPLSNSQQLFGVLGVRGSDAGHFQVLEERNLLDTCANVVALSLERDRSLAKARQAESHVQAEQLRNSLLSSISHDMRTPLAMIAVTAAGLLDESVEQHGMTKTEMLKTIMDESKRLARRVENLLELARLNSGNIVLDRQWHVLVELLGVSISRMRTELTDHHVRVDVPDEFPLLWISDTLFEQVFVNLIENAVRYTPAGSSLHISAQASQDQVEIRFADNGPGLASGSEQKIFGQFSRGGAVVPDGQRGMGLGLAICQVIIRAHGGMISASNRTEGGAEFEIVLPCVAQPPQIALDEPVAAAR